MFAGLATASPLATSAQVRAAEAKLQACIAGGNPLTSAGRHAIIACVMPAAVSPTARAKAEKCPQTDFASPGYGLTHVDRQAILTAGVACLQAK